MSGRQGSPLRGLGTCFALSVGPADTRKVLRTFRRNQDCSLSIFSHKIKNPAFAGFFILSGKQGSNLRPYGPKPYALAI